MIGIIITVLCMVVVAVATFYATSGYEYVQRNILPEDEFIIYNKRQYVMCQVFVIEQYLSVVEDMLKTGSFDNKLQSEVVHSARLAMAHYEMDMVEDGTPLPWAAK